MGRIPMVSVTSACRLPLVANVLVEFFVHCRVACSADLAIDCLNIVSYVLAYMTKRKLWNDGAKWVVEGLNAMNGYSVVLDGCLSSFLGS